ncbi:Rieske 2Fe-2S domain-containing protein [Tanticharoenia sakaeratensis]|uniref:3-phenylpropionate/cinnamic acid dioxygenase subunit alpha n=1 Tax=Tanticharoenia sakaeratensis NBRC 103193 TaxID=1231623 RepID=A0A0D6MMG9_9PROT|nr:Rieske 2Fe-2S domain-containing protein [Tanticharoenia sakaeratensis]GAN54478.1 3-phenylpropionate/cinnamic acid dioxygenase subunit alpha [Tanticharoenia sakaeratensis NBRC 103193]GBQ24232.1 Rieske 2Fe-2S domain-containing protein [Tanticharoenia sakaeratensis NBRC 103193]
MSATLNAEAIDRYRFPAADCSRIPYGMYRDPDIYALEQERIFRGPIWNFLALEDEIPNPGDFRLVEVGDTPVIVDRARDGSLHAMVNRCSHRGSIVQRATHGNAKTHVCCYHQWSFDLTGNLVGVPFQKGVKGVGGLPADFDKSCHALRKLRVESLNGAIFGTFSDDTPPLREYLGPVFTHQVERLFNRKLRILGYQRQRIFGNWKLYTDNLRDPNHGGLLHMFQITFGIARLNATGGAKLDADGKHNLSWAAQGGRAGNAEDPGKDYGDTGRGDMNIKLRDPSLLRYHKEFPDDLTLAVTSLFANAALQQIGNTLAVRQIRTRSADEFEIVSTFFGYEDDDEAMQRHRLRKANLAGPAGLVSMEDGEAVELVHRAIVRDGQDHSVVEFGGRGPVRDQENLISDVPMRGFWMYYCKLMGIPTGETAS